MTNTPSVCAKRGLGVIRIKRICDRNLIRCMFQSSSHTFRPASDGDAAGLWHELEGYRRVLRGCHQDPCRGTPQAEGSINALFNGSQTVKGYADMAGKKGPPLRRKSGINGPSLTGQCNGGYGGRRERNCPICTILVQMGFWRFKEYTQSLSPGSRWRISTVKSRDLVHPALKSISARHDRHLSLIIQAATRVPSKQAKMRSMPRLAAYLLGVAIALVYCSQTPSLQTAAHTSTSTLKNRIPPADPAKYRSIADSQKRLASDPGSVLRADAPEPFRVPLQQEHVAVKVADWSSQSRSPHAFDGSGKLATQIAHGKQRAYPRR